MPRKFTTRKFDGDDQYSWAVFLKEDLKGLPRGVIFYGQAKPLIAGLSASEAKYYKDKLENEARSKEATS